jgi:hypothetical protein
MAAAAALYTHGCTQNVVAIKTCRTKNFMRILPLKTHDSQASSLKV